MRSVLPALAATLLGAALASAQTKDGVYQLSGFANGDSSYNDVWGYVDPGTGREVAILGTYSNTVFLETTNPAAPVVLATIARAGKSGWGDFETWGTYAYGCSESGGGLQIFDLSDIDNIQLVKNDKTAFNSAHNLRVDQVLGLLLAPGANTGMPVLDLSNPASPVLVRNYTAQYVHDAFIRNGIAHLGQIYRGWYEIVDASTGSFPVLDGIQTPGAFTHNAWVDDQDRFAVTTDESSNGHLAIYDIQDPTNIQYLSSYSRGAPNIVHNAYVRGTLVHTSYYTQGYVAVDVADPLHPTYRAQFDQFLGADGQYSGSWGCYPFQPSGVIYMTDTSSGLYVLTLGVQIHHQSLGDTLDTSGPYPVVADIVPAVTGGAVTNPTIQYSTDGGQSFTPVAMTATGNPDEYTGDIPGVAAGTAVHYYLTAADGLGQTRWPRGSDHSYVFRVGYQAPIQSWDFEAGSDQGWAHSASRGTDDWQRGSLGGKAGDPVEGWSPSTVWGNDVGGASWNGAYPSNTTSTLRSPTLDLTGVFGTRLRFRRWLTLAPNDNAAVLVNGTPVWSSPGAGWQDDGWTLVDLDVSALADDQASVQVSFRLESNGSVELGGWNLDDLELYALDACAPPSNYGTGTAGSGGFVPTLVGTGGAPTLGNNQFGWRADQLLGGSFCGVFIGFGKASVPVKGITLLVDLTQPYFLRFRRASGPNGQPGVGSLGYLAPIPNDPQAVGVEVDVQVVAADPGGPQGLSATPGLTFQICQ